MIHNTKKVPHYNLEEIKLLIAKRQYIIRKIAIDNAQCDFDFRPKDIIENILNLQNNNFYKSMTSEYDNKIWQDVYHLLIDNEEAYIKLQIIDENSVIIQFKRK